MNKALLVAADLLLAGSASLLEANRADLARARSEKMGDAALDRLALDDRRIASMAAGLRQVAALNDPVGEVIEGGVRPNGLKIERVLGPSRGDRDHLREPSQRDQRCGRPVPQVRQRGLPRAGRRRRSSPTGPSWRCCGDALSKVGLAEDGVLLVEDTSHETALQFSCACAARSIV